MAKCFLCKVNFENDEKILSNKINDIDQKIFKNTNAMAYIEEFLKKHPNVSEIKFKSEELFDTNNFDNSENSDIDGYNNEDNAYDSGSSDQSITYEQYEQLCFEKDKLKLQLQTLETKKAEAEVELEKVRDYIKKMNMICNTEQVSHVIPLYNMITKKIITQLLRQSEKNYNNNNNVDNKTLKNQNDEDDSNLNNNDDSNIAKPMSENNKYLVVKIFDLLGNREQKKNLNSFNEIIFELKGYMKLIKFDYKKSGAVPIIEFITISNKTEECEKEYSLAVITPYFENKNICNWVEATRNYKYDENLLVVNATRILKTLKLLANNKKYHGHIKPTNLLISDCGKYLLLSDYIGIDYIIEYYSSFAKINDRFTAPELYKAIIAEGGLTVLYNLRWEKCDLFSFGLCLIYLCTKIMPDSTIHKNQTAFEEFINSFTSNNKQLDYIIKNLVKWNPLDRKNVSEENYKLFGII